MEELVETLKEIGVGEIATVVGRYFAMDRDKRWDRLEIALNGLIHGKGEDSEDPVATVKARYERGGDKDRDEFLTPIIVGGDESRIKGKVSSQNYKRPPTDSILQMTIPSSSSTTDPIVSARLPRSSVTSTDPSSPTSSSPRSPS